MRRPPKDARRRVRKPPAPLDAQRLEELALAYVARFASSAGRLAVYCRRKLRERGYVGAEEGASPPDIDALVERFVASGYVDDASYARVKTGGLLRRGYGARRVDQALRADAIADALREELAPGEAERREAAAAYARRRRLGPFARESLSHEGAAAPDPRVREKQLAALLRAGHDSGHARKVLGSATPDDVEEWVADARDQQDSV